MEFASFLAGEPWSDHPACTHPLLAQLARLVNDNVSDAGRQELTPLVPLVVGRSGDEHTWLALPVAVASSAILEVPEVHQRVLAAGLLRAEQHSAAAGLAVTALEARSALDSVPAATGWAEWLQARLTVTAQAFAERGAPTMVRSAVDGIVASGAPDRDRRLRALLEVAIASCPASASASVDPTPVRRRPHRAERRSRRG